jgi:UDP-N-acetylmuramoyl-tripeptide--D-alanyl-D-alanine ligase
MAAALDNFAMMEAPCKVALLGDMRELGADSVEEHVRILKKLDGCSLTHACLVGEEFRKAVEKDGERPYIQLYPTSDALAEALSQRPLEGATVLVKGSRGIRMEKVIPTL